MLFNATSAGPERTLLLVDDETSILSTLKRLLRREGYTILSANDGQAGLEILATHRVDVVLCDGLMRQMSGAEFLRVARRMYPDTVRIMLSGYTDPAVTLDAMSNCDLFRFLTKPWDDTELIHAVRAAFRHAEARRVGVETADA